MRGEGGHTSYIHTLGPMSVQFSRQFSRPLFGFLPRKGARRGDRKVWESATGHYYSQECGLLCIRETALSVLVYPLKTSLLKF